jgi:hypothetical protein
MYSCGPRLEIMQRYDADDGWRQRRRNLWVAHVGDVSDAVDLEVMNFGVEGRADLACGAGIVDHHPVGIDRIDSKPALRKPAGDGLDIRCRRAELGPNFGRTQPVMEIGRFRIVQPINQRPERLLLGCRPSQLQQHVRQRQAIGDNAAVVRRIFCLRTRVARQRHQVVLVDRLGDQRLRRQRRGSLRIGRWAHCEIERQNRHYRAGDSEAGEFSLLIIILRFPRVRNQHRPTSLAQALGTATTDLFR